MLFSAAIILYMVELPCLGLGFGHSLLYPSTYMYIVSVSQTTLSLSRLSLQVVLIFNLLPQLLDRPKSKVRFMSLLS